MLKFIGVSKYEIYGMSKIRINVSWIILAFIKLEKFTL
jgi:hypothetical protein